MAAPSGGRHRLTIGRHEWARPGVVFHEAMSAVPDIRNESFQDDPEAFAALYAAHQTAILRYLEAALRDAAEAEDALHEVFVKAWRSAHPDMAPAAMKSWLFTVARTTAIDHQRRRSRQHAVAPENLVVLADRRRPAHTTEVGHWISEPEVREVLSQLPARHQEIIVLRYVMGCSHAQTARALGTTELAIRKTHQRILAVLARALAASELAAERGTRRQQHAMRALPWPRRKVRGGFTLRPLRRRI